MILLMDTFNSR